MNADTIAVPVKGRYYWELLFSYDNSANQESTISDKLKYTVSKKVDSKEFLSNKLNVSTGFTFKNESSTSLTFEGVGEGSEKTEFSYHLDLAYELIKTSETNTTVDESTEMDKDYEVGPGDKLNLYRLCYESDGVLQKTFTVTTQPVSDIFVNLNFTCTKHILGLSDILYQFAHTFPGSSNTEEWARIRNSIVQSSDLTESDALHEFVQTLSGITPERDNRDEWAAIRGTCNEILNDWDSIDKQLLFKKLLNRFSVTVPSRDNRDEWAAIRSVSDGILSGLTQLWALQPSAAKVGA